ncbi:hypothetical protein GCM10009552_16070 [Rothia nasimurium]|uniref:Uncharacterized protein n=1 Tax=Luteibacter anthropi TaxID=564369 RepID=A0A7X5ZIV5_9GAMM|nr:hypothetical protein [Luteibacter anthropi]NII07267.1 hypothetical protein [Luteibacter anthropi]
MESNSNDALNHPENLAAFAKGTLLAIETLGAIVQGLAEAVGMPDMPLGQITNVQREIVPNLAPTGDAGKMFEAALLRLRHSVELVKQVQSEARGQGGGAS